MEQVTQGWLLTLVLNLCWKYDNRSLPAIRTIDVPFPVLLEAFKEIYASLTHWFPKDSAVINLPAVTAGKSYML